MEVILIQDVDNLGGMNEVVKVRNGYARNFLLPRHLAVENSPANRKQLEERMKQVKKKEDKMLAEVLDLPQADHASVNTDRAYARSLSAFVGSAVALP